MSGRITLTPNVSCKTRNLHGAPVIAITPVYPHFIHYDQPRRRSRLFEVNGVHESGNARNLACEAATSIAVSNREICIGDFLCYHCSVPNMCPDRESWVAERELFGG